MKGFWELSSDGKELKMWNNERELDLQDIEQVKKSMASGFTSGELI